MRFKNKYNLHLMACFLVWSRCVLSDTRYFIYDCDMCVSWFIILGFYNKKGRVVPRYKVKNCKQPACTPSSLRYHKVLSLNTHNLQLYYLRLYTYTSKTNEPTNLALNKNKKVYYLPRCYIS